VTDTELNWLYSALIARQPIDPSYLMINRWCCEATSGSEDIGSGCYLSLLAIVIWTSLGPLDGYQDRQLGGPLGQLGLCHTAPDGVGRKDCSGGVLE
jgi:hypothetical protein